MAAIVVGIILIIVSAITWFGHLTLLHALALLIGAIGVLVLLGGVIPGQYWHR